MTPMAAGAPGGRLEQAGDVRLHVTEVGSGPPVVWLHGTGPASSATATFDQRLGAFGSFRNLLVDLPRFGRSERPAIDEPFISYAARRVEWLLDALGVERAMVVGNAAGGGVALKLAADRPDLVDRVAGIAVGGAFPPGWTPPEALHVVGEYAAAPEPSRELVAQVFRNAVHDADLITDELLDARLEDARRTHPELPAPMILGDVNQDLAAVRAPTLLLWGREDRYLGLDVARFLLEHVPDCELHVLPRCGHWVHADRPADFDHIVFTFLSKRI